MATTPSNSQKRFQLLKTQRKLAVALVVLAVILLGVGMWFLLKPKETEDLNVTTAEVTQGPIEKTVAATGKVVPNFEVEIKGKASGKIIHLPYDVSDMVPQGALLVELDPIDENRQVSQAAASLAGLESRTAQSQVNLRVARQTLATDIARAKADLNAAEAKFKDAQTKAQRLATLVQSRYISQEEAETGTTTAAQAKTDLENARVRLRELQTQQLSLTAQAEDVEYAAAQAQAQRVALASSQQRLEETKIYAPISGVVTSRAGQIGQIVASGINNVSGGTAIMTLADLSHIYALASVDESDIGQVREGQIVNITADAFPGQKFQGRVVRISPKGIAESNVVTFEVKIEVISANRQLLKPEMTTNVEIVLEAKNKVLKVPAEAVVSGRNGRSFVLVQKSPKPGDKPERRPVVVGLNNGTEAEIREGLALGEKVIVNRGQTRSRWRREQGGQGGQGGGQGGRRGQMMMMRSFGRR